MIDPPASTPSPAAIDVHISGRVQGVFFRDFTCKAASQLGLRGWVENCPDGRVRLQAIGDPAAIARLLQAVHRGPPLARVERVELLPLNDTQALPDHFEIR